MSQPDPGARANIRTFLEMQAAEKGAARNTLDAYARDLGDLAQFLDDLGRPVEEATPADLTAYVSQRIKDGYYEVAGNAELAAKTAIMGALSLYLDFINMFTMLLSLFGNRE